MAPSACCRAFLRLVGAAGHGGLQLAFFRVAGSPERPCQAACGGVLFTCFRSHPLPACLSLLAGKTMLAKALAYPPSTNPLLLTPCPFLPVWPPLLAGKTMLAKALARECDACFILLKSSTILRWVVCVWNGWMGGWVGGILLKLNRIQMPALPLPLLSAAGSAWRLPRRGPACIHACGWRTRMVHPRPHHLAAASGMATPISWWRRCGAWPTSCSPASCS